MTTKPDTVTIDECLRVYAVNIIRDEKFLQINPPSDSLLKKYDESRTKAKEEAKQALFTLLNKELRNYLAVQEGDDANAKPYWIKAIPEDKLRKIMGLE